MVEKAGVEIGRATGFESGGRFAILSWRGVGKKVHET
jgi:hypothetical protein